MGSILKLFPRGSDMEPMLFDGGQRTATAFYYFAERNIPGHSKKIYYIEDIEPWAKEVRLICTLYLL